MSITIVLLVCLVGTQPPCPSHDPIAREIGPTWIAAADLPGRPAPQPVRGV